MMMTMEQAGTYILDSWKIYEHLPESDRDSSPEYHAFGQAFIAWAAYDSVPEALTALGKLKEYIATHPSAHQMHPEMLTRLLDCYQTIIDTIKGEEQQS